MIDKQDYMFCIGYSGETAVVDGRLKNKYSKLTGVQLAEKGMFKAAICSAVYDDNREELEKILEIYNTGTDFRVKSPESLKSLFGVTGIPEGISRISVIS